jgi:hypothetical protein
MRLTLLAVASAALLATGGCGDGATEAMELRDGPLAIARAYYEGLTTCDERKAAVAFELWESPPARDRGSWIDTTLQNCKENVPSGPRRIAGEVMERTPDEASVRVTVTWDAGGSVGNRLRLARTEAGWRIAGYAPVR